MNVYGYTFCIYVIIGIKNYLALDSSVAYSMQA